MYHLASRAPRFVRGLSSAAKNPFKTFNPEAFTDKNKVLDDVANPSTKSAIFIGCDLKPNDVAEISAAAKNNPSLEAISVAMPSVSDELALEVSELLYTNPLARFSLATGEISEAAAVRISTPLASNTALTDFHLIANLSDATVDDMVVCADKSSTVTVLTLGSHASVRKYQPIIERNLIIREALIDYAKTIFGVKVARAVIAEISGVKKSVTSLEEELRKGVVGANDETFKELGRKYDIITSLESINLEVQKDWLLRSSNKILLRGLSHHEIAMISEAWHQVFFRTKRGELKDYAGNASWPSLIGEQQVEIPPEVIGGKKGYTLKVITNVGDLKKEGEAMDHCVKGSAEICVRGNSHVFAVLNERGVSVATLLVEANPFLRTIEVESEHGFRGFHDSTVPQELEAIPHWFIETFSGKINHDFIEYERQRRISTHDSFKDAATGYLAFDPTDDVRVRDLTRLMWRLGPRWLKPNLSRSISYKGEVGFPVGEDVLPLVVSSAIKKEQKVFVVPSHEEFLERVRKKREAIEVTVPNMQKNLDKLFGEGAVVVAKLEDKKRLSFSFVNFEVQEKFMQNTAFRREGVLCEDRGNIVVDISIRKLAEMFEKMAAETPANSVAIPNYKSIDCNNKGFLRKN